MPFFLLISSLRSQFRRSEAISTYGGIWEEESRAGRGAELQTKTAATTEKTVQPFKNWRLRARSEASTSRSAWETSGGKKEGKKGA